MDRKNEVPEGKLPYYILPILHYHKVHYCYMMTCVGSDAPNCAAATCVSCHAGRHMAHVPACEAFTVGITTACMLTCAPRSKAAGSALRNFAAYFMQYSQPILLCCGEPSLITLGVVNLMLLWWVIAGLHLHQLQRYLLSAGCRPPP